MTGSEMRTIRVKAGLSWVEFGRQVFGFRGTDKTVKRTIRGMEGDAYLAPSDRIKVRLWQLHRITQLR